MATTPIPTPTTIDQSFNGFKNLELGEDTFESGVFEAIFFHKVRRNQVFSIIVRIPKSKVRVFKTLTNNGVYVDTIDAKTNQTKSIEWHSDPDTGENYVDFVAQGCVNSMDIIPNRRYKMVYRISPGEICTKAFQEMYDAATLYYANDDADAVPRTLSTPTPKLD